MKKTIELLKKNDELKVQQTQTLFYTILSIIVAILLIIAIFAYIGMRKAHKKISQQKEVIEEARLYYVGMYKQYGLDVNMIGQDFLNETIAKRLQEREFVGQMSDRVIYRKAYDKVREMITIKDKKSSVEDYFKHVNKHKEAHGE